MQYLYNNGHNLLNYRLLYDSSDKERPHLFAYSVTIRATLRKQMRSTLAYYLVQTSSVPSDFREAN